METTINKNTKYNNKDFFVNRIKNIKDLSIKNQLNSKVVMFLNSVKEKHT
jgi:hypothetical protein